MNTIHKYVVGFAFNLDCNMVLLVEKNRPDWQKGSLNGIGGKIEDGETPLQVMIRECKEETGLHLNWKNRCFMSGTNNNGEQFECHIFYSYSSNLFDFQQIEDETLHLLSVSLIPQFKTNANVKFLIPYGICDDKSKFMILKY